MSEIPGIEGQEQELPESEQNLRRLTDAVDRSRERDVEVTDETARDIARRIRAGRGEDKYLDGFIAVGVIGGHDRLLKTIYQDAINQIPDEQKLSDALLTYCIGREYKGVVGNWCRDEIDRETESGYQPRVYIASLADYNNGDLYGVWTDAFQGVEALKEVTAWMLHTSPVDDAEEYAIHDYEGFAGYRLHEYTSLDHVAHVAEAIAEKGDAMAEWLDYADSDDEETIAKFDAAYRGKYDSMKDFCEEYTESVEIVSTLEKALEAIPEDYRQYIEINYDNMARDWSAYYYEGDAAEGGVHIFDTSA